MQKVTRSAVIDAPVERVWQVLRDFNSHSQWHPVVAESHIEGGLRSDQVGCVRNFRLADGNHLREQLLVLDDRRHISTYCILDATLPMQRYVATQRLERVTDGDRTFIHWQSTFEVPPGLEAEYDERVGDGVYIAGIQALRAWLKRGGAPTTTPRPVAGQPARAVRLARHGGPEVLEPVTVQVGAPGAGEIRVRHTAIGVNYIDVYIRNGEYGGLITLPGVPGMEAAGVVDAVGAGVDGFDVGDRVATLTPQPGSYAAVRNVPAAQAVRLPARVSDEQAAALMLKGITAHYLLHDLGRVGPGSRVLVHAAAGGVGVMAASWARSLGASVVGTVGSDAKVALAREHGCDRVVVARSGLFADAVLEATGGRGADLILDGLGASARDENMRCLASRGHWVAFGHASGAMAPVPADWLGSRSATFSRPVVFHYTAEASELQRRARAVFDAFASGALRMPAPARYPLAAAAAAHADLEARRTTGAVVLIP